MFCGFGLLHTEAESLHQFGEVFFYDWSVSLSVNRRQPALIGSPSFGISPTDNLTNDSKTLTQTLPGLSQQFPPLLLISHIFENSPVRVVLRLVPGHHQE